METEDLDGLEKMKIIMLGESGVGKTCLINRYINNTFDTTEPTTGAFFKYHILTSSDRTVKITQQIWDTAGQEAYRSLASCYFKDADAAILIFDITNRKSFCELSYWLKEANEHSNKDLFLTIAGNKSDKVDEEQVDIVEASEYSRANKASFFLVSAKENSNVTEMYTELGIRKFPELRGKLGFKDKKQKNILQEIDKVKLKQINKRKKNCC